MFAIENMQGFCFGRGEGVGGGAGIPLSNTVILYRARVTIEVAVSLLERSLNMTGLLI